MGTRARYISNKMKVTEMMLKGVSVKQAYHELNICSDVQNVVDLHEASRKNMGMENNSC